MSVIEALGAVELRRDLEKHIAGAGILRVKTYLIDHVGGALLARAATGGMTVRVLTADPRNHGPAAERTRRVIEDMRKSGVEVKIQRGQPLHAKAVIHPGGIVWIGSSNLTMGGLRSNRETNVRITDPIFWQRLVDDFDRVWSGGPPRMGAGLIGATPRIFT